MKRQVLMNPWMVLTPATVKELELLLPVVGNATVADLVDLVRRAKNDSAVLWAEDGEREGSERHEVRIEASAGARGDVFLERTQG